MAFITQPIPQPEETLTSLIIRLADANGLPHIKAFMQSAGIYRNSNDFVAFTLLEESKRLSELLGVPHENVATLMHPKIEGEDTADLVRYHGLRMRRQCLDSRYRRFSPASLRRSAYHRSRWDVRLLTFCPESFEILRSGCPNCGSPLGWWAPLTKCHHCNYDIRHATSAQIPEADREIAAWTANLVCVDDVARNRAWSEIDPGFRALGEVRVLDLLAIFGAIAEDPAETKSLEIVRRLRSGDFSKWTTPMLISGAEIVRDWPAGFFRLVADVVAHAPERNRSFGRKYLLGFLAHLANPHESNKVFAEYFRPLIEEGLARAENKQLSAKAVVTSGLAIIMADEIEERFGICRPTVNKWAKDLDLFAGRELSAGRRVGFNREEFERLLMMWEKDLPNTESCQTIMLRTRLPTPALVYLVKMGLLQDAGREMRVLRASRGWPIFFKNSVERTFSEKISNSRYKPETGIALGTALNFAEFLEEGWSDALEAVLTGRLPAALSGDASVKFAYQIIVDPVLLEAVLTEAATSNPDHVPLGLAAALVKIENCTLVDAIAAGLLAGHGENLRYTTWRAVLDFKREFASTSQLASECGISLRAASGALKKTSLALAFPRRKERQVIYRRTAALQAIEAAVRHPRPRSWKRRRA